MNPLEFMIRFLVSIILLSILIPVIIVLGIYKFIICVIVSYRFRDLHFINLDEYVMMQSYNKPSTNVNYILGIAVFEGEMTLEEFRNLAWEYSFNKGVSKFGCRAVEKYGYWFWKYSPESVDVNYHLDYLPGLKNPLNPVTDDEVYNLINKENHNTRTGCPKWRTLLIPNFIRKEELNKENVKRKFAILLTNHHSYCDGQSAHNILIKKPGTKCTDQISTESYPRFLMFFHGLQNISYLIDLIYENVKGYTKQQEVSESSKFHISSSQLIDIDVFRNIRKKAKTTTISIMYNSLREAVEKYSIQNKNFLPVLKSTFTVCEGMPPALQLYPDSVNNGTFCRLLGLHRNKKDTLENFTAVDKSLKSNRFAYPLNFLKLLASVFPNWLAPHQAKSETLIYNVLILCVPGLLNPEVAFGKYPLLEIQSLIPVSSSVMNCTFSASCGFIRLNALIHSSTAKSQEEAQQFVDSWRECILETKEKLDLYFGDD